MTADGSNLVYHTAVPTSLQLQSSVVVTLHDTFETPSQVHGILRPRQDAAQGHAGRIPAVPLAPMKDEPNKRSLFSVDLVLFHLLGKVHL